MTIQQARLGARAFSLIELLCVLAIIGMLAALLLPALSKANAHAKRLQCVNNLRQIGIGFQNFAQDHNGQFPMSVPVNAGGSLEFAQNAYGIAGEFYFSFRHFQILSNELVTPKLLICPTDTRQPAPSFTRLGNEALSYFVGISAVSASPGSILAGDRNLTNERPRLTTLLRFGPNHSLRWTSELHQYKGNLLFADGRVEERNTPGLGLGSNQGLIIADLALPTIQNHTPIAASRDSTSPPFASPEAALSTDPALTHISQNAGPDGQTTSHPDIANRPGWSTSLSSSKHQPDSPLPQANLQPGTNSKVFVTNSTGVDSGAEDRGFSLFPPLFGQGGMLNSRGGHWVLIIMILVLILGAGVLLKRRLTKTQLLRKVWRDIFPML